MKKNLIYTDQAPAAIGPYSQGMAFGNLVFLSGQLGLDSQAACRRGWRSRPTAP